MAIHPDYPGLEVHVSVNGVPLREYDLPADFEEDTPNAATLIKYIEVAPGAEFAVQVHVKPSFRYIKNDISYKVQLDGGLHVSRVLQRDRLIDRPLSTFDSVKMFLGDQFVRRNFVFSNLMTDDRPVDEYDMDLSRIDKLGQITVRLCRVKTLGPKPRRGRQQEFDIDTVPEKALKGRALSRKVNLGPAVPTNPKSHSHYVEHIDAKDKPFAFFVFRYRSLGDLKAEMIIPRSPSPVPLEDRPLDELSQEEMRELLKRQKGKKDEAARIKRELKRERSVLSSAFDADDDEIAVVATKKRRIVTIDLTND